MIAASNLSKHYGDQTLFEGASIQFNPGERYGIVGANGSGKSTLLKILAGDELASGGEVSIPKRARVGVLRQDHFQYENDRILDVVMMGNAPLWQAMVKKEKLLENADQHFDADAYAEVEDIILQMDGYTHEARAGEVLEGLGIETEVHNQPLSVLSGGFKLRVLLAQVLAAEPDVLFLDEPTNHLDILSIRWLEKFLNEYKGCTLVVSHDHRFLDNVSTFIVDVDYETVTLYRGNYTHFTRAKVEDRERREKEIQKREKEIADHKAFIDRFKAKASKARQAQSKVKQVEKIEIETLPQSSRRYPNFKLEQRRPSGKQVLEVKGISKAYGDKQVLDNISLTVTRGEKIAIIGPNGIGKSTLLKIAMGEVEADAGEIEWGYETHPGYFAQDHHEQLANDRQTVEAWLWDFCPGEQIGFVRGHLGMVLFSGDEAEKKLGSLSGGEAARLIFARQMIQKPNVLVLDEPTNHLDLEAIESLVKGLNKFPGTLIFVSHDRWFVGELADRIIEVTPSGINDFKGSYEEYLEKLGDDHLDSDVVLKKVRAAKRKARENVKPKSQSEQKELRREKARKTKRLEAITEELQSSEQRINQINEKFCDPTFFDRTPHNEVAKLEREQKDLTGKIDQLMEEWETLEEEMAELAEA
jgi:ATPase subunit of ABC transporter with duplicated ATPase domains